MYCPMCDSKECHHVTNPVYIRENIAYAERYIAEAKEQLIALETGEPAA